MIDPPVWSKEQLEQERERATDAFREQRKAEPSDIYSAAFDAYRRLFEELLQGTANLTNLNQTALDLLTDSRLAELFRYLTGPPTSADDLKTTAKAVLTASRLKKDPEMVSRIVSVVLSRIDRQRFPWLTEDRAPTEGELKAAAVASAALMATRNLQTLRRGEGKTLQEQRVETAIMSAGFTNVPTRTVSTGAQVPGPGEFCRESLFGSGKADFIVGLWDQRTMPIECKVSNSATNSVKRLNHDAAVKAVNWQKDFGELNVVPTAILSGVYSMKSLLEAQKRGLSLFWAHELLHFTSWINRTRPG
jgi:hypothetical protein